MRSIIRATVIVALLSSIALPVASSRAVPDILSFHELAKQCTWKQFDGTADTFVKSCSEFLVDIGVIDSGFHEGDTWAKAYKNYTFASPTDDGVQLVKQKLGHSYKWVWKVRGYNFKTKRLSEKDMKSTLKRNKLSLSTDGTLINEESNT